MLKFFLNYLNLELHLKVIFLIWISCVIKIKFNKIFHWYKKINNIYKIRIFLLKKHVFYY